MSIGHGAACAVRRGGELVCWGDTIAGKPEWWTPPAGTFTQVDVKPELACALRTDGAAACWGIPSGVGADDPPAGRFTVASAGASHACGLRPSGEVECWGNPGFGITDAPAGRFVSVSAGGGVSCAVSDSGEVECWGRLAERGWSKRCLQRSCIPVRELRDVPSGRFTSIDMYFDTEEVCGIADGLSVCWGNASGTVIYRSQTGASL